MQSGHAYKHKSKMRRGRGFGDGDGDGRDTWPSGPYSVNHLNRIIALNGANNGANYINHILRRIDEDSSLAQNRDTLVILSEEIAENIASAIFNGPPSAMLPGSWQELHVRFEAAEVELNNALKSTYKMRDDQCEGFKQMFWEICTELANQAARDVKVGLPDYSLH